MTARDTIKQNLQKVIQELTSKKLGDSLVELINLEIPKDNNNGDYSSSIALQSFRTFKERFIKGEKLSGLETGIGNPHEMAVKIKELYLKLNDENVKRVEVAGSGFINFYLSKKYLHSQLKEIISKKNEHGLLDLGKGKKASVEYVSANPTGPLHIGNARGGPIGDVLANVLEKVGYRVTREYLHNDVGGQVKVLGATIKAVSEGKRPEEGQYKGEYINELSEKLKGKLAGKSDEGAGQMAVDIIFQWIMDDVKKMGISFDAVTKESDLRKKTPPVLKKIEKSLKEKDGALWFAPNDEFLKDRETVVKKSNGELTYFSSDIAYHFEKMSKNDLVVDVLGSNHSGHVPRLNAVAKALGFDAEKLRIILYQYVRVKKGKDVVKMSKRAGDFVTAREVLDEVGKDAFRFFLLASRAESHIDFDLELAKKQASENPVFYIQYAHSRICSVFKNVERITYGDFNIELLLKREELDLIRHLIKLPTVIREISTLFNVNILTTYSLELASKFHRFYESSRILSEDKDLTYARLTLIKATQIVLSNTLSLMGISAPEKM
ncbi:arginine--tRNA ligase [Patescibacteria group bacterium]|nr:arginine--tRNA ligase [Patescibacteria group bacterium]